MKKSRWILFLILVLVFSSLALGSPDTKWHMKLLAVQEVSNGTYKGDIADLYLELKPGSGRVFLETFPLTKMDTQISTRFAKEMACDYFDLNCQGYDFIYTLRAGSNIIGGPSAGAAISALTTLALLNLNYDKKTTITGTINSGGIIGLVGGTKEKIEAASKNSLKKVLIAKGSRHIKENNQTFDLIEYGKNNLSLTIVEVSSLNDLVFQLTGKRLKKENLSVKINKNYQMIMKDLNNLLCDRTNELEKELEKYSLNESEKNSIREKINNSKLSQENKDYYSAASYCFSVNIIMRDLIYNKEGKNINWILQEVEILKRKVKLVEEKLAKEKIQTISDLQTMMIVKERLSEVKEKFKEIKKTDDQYYVLALAQERFFSAVSWMYFFNMPGKEFSLDSEKLKNSCLKKISESEERYQYVEIIFGGFPITYIKEKINEAKKNLNSKEYGLCLMKAVQGKAQANAILNSLGLDKENMDDFLEGKKSVTKNVIAASSQEGVFPILGYSYFQYANSLKSEDKHSSLLYLEYALEMSDLDIYFKKEKRVTLSFPWIRKYRDFVILISGFVSGALAMLFIIQSRKIVKKRRQKRDKQVLINMLKKKQANK